MSLKGFAQRTSYYTHNEFRDAVIDALDNEVPQLNNLTTQEDEFEPGQIPMDESWTNKKLTS